MQASKYAHSPLCESCQCCYISKDRPGNIFSVQYLMLLPIYIQFMFRQTHTQIEASDSVLVFNTFFMYPFYERPFLMTHYAIYLEVCRGCVCSCIRACLRQLEKPLKSDRTQASNLFLPKSGVYTRAYTHSNRHTNSPQVLRLKESEGFVCQAYPFW